MQLVELNLHFPLGLGLFQHRLAQRLLDFMQHFHVSELSHIWPVVQLFHQGQNSLRVLGDQKKGNNLEAPESLLRQIVREESGKGQGDGNTYNVTVNASGRKLLDIIIDEAELRRRRNGGQNPFLLGGV